MERFNMTRPADFLRMISTILALIFAPALASAATYDALTQWNPTTNTSTSLWRYGTSTTLAGTFTNMPTHGSQVSTPAYDWWSFTGPFIGPVMGFNSSGSTITFATPTALIWPADEVLIAPGAKNGTPSFITLRWLAPESGLYDINGKFSDLQRASVITDILVGGASLSSGSFAGVSAHQGDHPFQLSKVFLGQGQTVDFVVGSLGEDGNDVLGIQATISAVPEPAAVVLFGLGAAGLIVIARRRTLS
jgi:PEP-CTERM motif